MSRPRLTIYIYTFDIRVGAVDAVVRNYIHRTPPLYKMRVSLPANDDDTARLPIGFFFLGHIQTKLKEEDTLHTLSLLFCESLFFSILALLKLSSVQIAKLWR